ncbi:LPXTG cell wall anchor domain-containing protein [Pseudarthrobacter albicanus]|uniref:LPXTG cell wall anchor domain-containing protein n=1 Tax=Pseudarthrobacter albicanus TaxID=2823873 RepID=UPI001BA8CC3C|nr:LPXTG cell wall anchor domain-containing protein [Pseudarthrobacter albicanus]
MKKTLAVIALAGSLGLMGAVPAMAADGYPAPKPSGTVSDGTVGRDQSFTFSGQGFGPSEQVTITVYQGRGNGNGAGALQTYQVTADANGAFTYSLKIGKPGAYTVKATGASGQTASAFVNVKGPAAAQGTVSNGTVAPGKTFVFSSVDGGFTPGETIQVTATLTGTPQAIGGSFSGGASMAVPAKIILPLAPLTFTTTADASGNFAIPLDLPAEGTYILTAEGLTSGKTVTSSVTVDAAAAGSGTGLANTGGTAGGTATSGTGLANTGADTSLVLWSLVGAGALAAGVTSVVVVRRRAKADTSA